jgi:hypothetical protein
VNGKARSRMPREGRDTSGACVGLMLVVHCQSLLNLHWIIFSRETVAAAGGYNKQAKRSPSPTSIPILSLQSVPDNTSRIQRYFSVATITIRAAENPVVLSAEREKMPAAVLLTSSPPLACSSSSFSMSSSLGAVVGAAKLPPSLPLLGHLHLIGCLPHRSLHALHLRGGSDGGLLPLQLGRRRALVASTAAAARDLFRNHDLASRPAGQRGGEQAHVWLQQRVLRAVQRAVALPRTFHGSYSQRARLYGPG